MLKSIKSLKIYCKATLNMFLNKNVLSSSKILFIKKHIQSSFTVSFQCFYTIKHSFLPLT